MTLTLYLTRMVGGRILAAAAVLLILGVGFDLLRSAGVLVERGGTRAVFLYAWLRVPQIAANMLPVAVLMGATVAFLSLSSRSEAAVIRAAGISIFRLLVRLVPLALLLGGAYSVLGDRLTERAEIRINEAFPPVEAEVPPGSRPEAQPVWVRTGGEVIRAHPATREGDELERVTIYRLDDDGHLATRLFAARATRGREGWTLSDVEITRAGQIEIDSVAEMSWSTPLRPRDVFKLAEGRRFASSAAARKVLAGEAAATRGRDYYSTRIARSYSAWLLPGVMLLISALAIFGSTRSGGGRRLSILAVVLGFLYIAIDGFLGSLGEVGAVAPYLAAFAPSAFFAIVGLWGLILLEN